MPHCLGMEGSLVESFCLSLHGPRESQVAEEGPKLRQMGHSKCNLQIFIELLIGTGIGVLEMHRHVFCPPAREMAFLPFALLRTSPAAPAEEVGVAMPRPHDYVTAPRGLR